MSIRLISKTERLVYEIEGSKFFYKRVFPAYWNDLKRKHTKRGMVDMGAAGFDLLETHVIGWENVVDEKNKEVPFAKELILQLPDPILADLIVAINGNVYTEDGEAQLETEKK